MSDQSHQQADQINNTNSFNTNKDGNQLVGNTVSGDINIGLSAEEVATTAIFVGKQLVKYAAQPLAHALLALKLGDEMDWSESLADLDDLADILERLTGDFENAQDGQDFFNKAGRITAKRIATAFEQLQDPLSEERLDLLTKQFSTLLKDTVLPTLLQTHFDRDAFIKKISNLPLDPAAYEAEEQPIIKRALGLTAELIFESADEIDNFTVATFGAFLKKTHLILEKVERVADQLASIHGSTYGEMQISAHEEFELSYRRLLSKKLDRLKLFGVPDFENHYLPLSPAYISLLARPLIEKDSGNHGENEPHFQKKQLSERFAELRQAEQVQPQTIEEVMAKHQRIFITGGAGAGKTTLLKKVAVYASNQQLPEELSEWRGKIPFFFRLRDITPDNPLPTTLDELPLKTQLTGLPSNPTRYVQQRFRSKQAILLIDGFDEVEEALQLETLEFVENVLEQHPDTICVLSGRPEVLQTEAIRQQLTQQTFMHIELQRMTAEQISQFIGLWFGALQKLVAENPSLLPEESASRLSVQQQQIQGQIRHSPQLRELATTPLLCALICALFQRNHQVNGKNVHELYQIGLRMLLKQRDGDRGIGLKRYGKLPEYADWKRPLAEIAYRSIEQNEPTIEADDLSHLLKIDGFETDVLIEYLTERASLLERLPNRRFEFLHRSFAEYLAALHIIDKRLVNVKWLHAARLDQAHWEGTIRQLVLNGVEADQTAILEALASGDEGDHSREETARHVRAMNYFELISGPTSEQSDLFSHHAVNFRKQFKSQSEIRIANDNLMTLRWLNDWADASQLERLELSHTAVTDERLSHLQALSQLKLLYLSNTAVTNEGLTHLQTLSQLQVLQLDNTAVTDEGLTHLQSLSQLQWLNLNYTAVTDEGLTHLQALSQLEVLQLNNTAVTTEGRQNLQNQLPRLRILV